MRYLAIDLGDRRTGLALGDSVTGIASPCGLIEVPLERNGGEDLLLAIEKAALRELGPAGSAGELVMGLPLNMDGSEGPAATKIRLFAERVARRTLRVVHVHDERLSTADADERMSRSGLTRDQKKRRRDAIAAAGILRSFLSERAE
ncbi:MAG: Holliday junction resolvase RuvX [Phycisphaeraceae bacterium]|nr:Holliday junction resolvase RuvX [Phycisphaeraceae bacterium]MCW5762052.1 Holliday junction resolvase RuvX [Phycisphaeraceae bacterium]